MDEKEFKSLLSQLEKDFGKGSIISLTKNKADYNIESFSSGSLLLDDALGINGYPKGRIIEIFGPESSGKTTLSLMAIAEIQKINQVAAFVDVEHAIDIKYAEKLGINLDKLIISQPNSGEQALEIVDRLVKSEMISLIVVDSVAALVPIAEIEGTMEDVTVGTQARLMSKSLRKLSGSASKNGTTIIFINQLREKIGVMFGNPEVTPGGRALKFFSSIRIDIRKREILKDKNGISYGQKVKVKVVKNKVAPPYKEVIIDLNYEFGVDKLSELIDLAVEMDIINKNGSWYSYEENKIGQGKEQVKIFLLENDKTLIKIKKQALDSRN